MAIYRDRTTRVLVDAHKFTQEHLLEYAQHQAGAPLGVNITHICTVPGSNPNHRRTVKDYFAVLETPEGKVQVEVGDWIVQTPEGKKAFKAVQFTKQYIGSSDTELEEERKPPAGGVAKQPATKPPEKETGN